MNALAIVVGLLLLLGLTQAFSKGPEARGTPKRNVRTGPEPNYPKSPTPKPKRKTPSGPPESFDRLLYKSVKVRDFEMRGMYYRNLSESDIGFFWGYAVPEHNDHDRYAVAIFNSHGKHLAYIPRHNRRMSDSIHEWHGGQVDCWGYLEYNDYSDRFYGTVFIPVGFEQAQVQKLKTLKESIQDLERRTSDYQSLTTEQKIKHLESYTQILKEKRGFRLSEHAPVFFPKQLIPSLSGALEKNKRWRELAKLAAHEEAIAELSEKFAAVTRRRVEHAKQQLIDPAEE
jgi:hypothetical protein